MQETWVQSLGLEGALEKEMATHSRILAWEIPWTEEPGMLQSMLILCRPLLLLPPIPPSIRDFSNESTLCMRWSKYWSFRLGMQPWALSLPDKELCLREALAVCTPPAPEPSAKRPGS